ncbi:hypothetical protein NE615_27980, partial [Escherichia coli]
GARHPRIPDSDYYPFLERFIVAVEKRWPGVLLQFEPHRDCSDETGEVADPVIVEDIEPGIYYGISNENYHAGPGVSKSQFDDIADTPALYLWRKNA